MGAPRFSQIKDLPINVSGHGITDVYTKSEIDLLLEQFAKNNKLRDIIFPRQSGAIGSGNNIIIDSIPLDPALTYLLFINDILIPPTNYSIDAVLGLVANEPFTLWAEDNEYDIVLMDLPDIIPGYNVDSIVDVSTIKVDWYVKNDDLLFIYLNGEMLIEGSDYFIDDEYNLHIVDDIFHSGDELIYVVTKSIPDPPFIDITNVLVEDVPLNEYLNNAFQDAEYTHPADHPVSMIIGAASTEYVDQKIADLVNSSPGTLDTLNELAAALGDDPNFATSIISMINAITAKTTVGGETFNSTTGRTISHPFNSVDFAVAITPVANPNGYLGEVWVIRSTTNFVVYCSGTFTGGFTYIATKFPDPV